MLLLKHCFDRKIKHSNLFASSWCNDGIAVEIEFSYGFDFQDFHDMTRNFHILHSFFSIFFRCRLLVLKFLSKLVFQTWPATDHLLYCDTCQKQYVRMSFIKKLYRGVKGNTLLFTMSYSGCSWQVSRRKENVLMLVFFFLLFHVQSLSDSSHVHLQVWWPEQRDIRGRTHEISRERRGCNLLGISFMVVVVIVFFHV